VEDPAYCNIYDTLYFNGGAAPDNYKVTYTINIQENGSAIWNVEYRTLLSTKEDFDTFEIILHN